MTKPNRREALAALLTFGLAGTAGSLPAEILEPGEPVELADNEPQDYPAWAQLLARLELSANRSLHPTWWQRLHYTGMIPWSDEPSIIVFYGIGRPHQTADDAAQLLAWIAEDYGFDSPSPIVGCYRTPCGRSWAVLVHAECADVGHDQPAWREVYGERLRTWEQSRGRKSPRAFMV